MVYKKSGLGSTLISGLKLGEFSIRFYDKNLKNYLKSRSAYKVVVSFNTVQPAFPIKMLEILHSNQFLFYFDTFYTLLLKAYSRF